MTTFPSEPQLLPSIVRDRRVGVFRSLVFGVGVAIGSSSLALLAWSASRPAPASPTIVGPQIVIPPIVVPPPIVLTIENTTTTPAPPPKTALRCPVIDRPDLAIGKALDPMPDAYEPTSATVVAAAHGSQLAVRDASGAVWVSQDDGRSFDRAFVGRPVESIAIDREGVVYAIAGPKKCASREDDCTEPSRTSIDGKDALGVLAPGGRARWREAAVLACMDAGPCERAVAVLEDELVVIVNDQIAISKDRGRSWKRLVDPAYAWADHGRLFPWRGALYQVSHYQDMCGIDDLSTYRLDARGKIAHEIFHNEGSDDRAEPVLRPSSNVDTTWTWRERCRSADATLGPCPRTDPTRTDLLTAAQLLPAEGGRTLAFYEGSLIELCPEGVRQVYRSFPFSQLDAVDAVGRALVMVDHRLLRWSPIHGWRALHTFPGTTD